MTTISIKTNFPEVMARLYTVQKDIADKALARSLNRTVEQGKVQMAKQISSEFRVSSSDVKRRLNVRRAIARGQIRLEAMLEATRRGQGRSMNLINFVEGKTTLAEAKRRGKKGTLSQVHFQIKRTGGKKVISGAFIGNDGRTVFIREGKSRLPIKALSTIDVTQMFNTRRVNKVVRQVMLAKFPANFERELRAVLKGFAK